MIRKLILVLIVAVGVVAIGSLFVNRLRYHHQDLKSCFNDAGGLQAGASVRSVRANPQNKNCPAEVEMVLATTYEIGIPNDSVAGIEPDGLLGRPYLSIDTTQASGVSIKDYGYLKSKPSKAALPIGDQIKAADVLLRLFQAAKEADKEIPKDSSPSPRQPSR
ncbi:MAG: MlaD family protein [Terriglobales bacterium]|jgi:ABC-type transporter Mla subunit MlaD